MLTIRRSNCINTASGIVFSVSDRPLLHTGRSLTENTIPDSVLIIRRSDCVNTASAIVLSVSDRPLLHTGRSLTENTIPDAVINTIQPPNDEHSVARNV